MNENWTPRQAMEMLRRMKARGLQPVFWMVSEQTWHEMMSDAEWLGASSPFGPWTIGASRLYGLPLYRYYDLPGPQLVPEIAGRMYALEGSDE